MTALANLVADPGRLVSRMKIGVIEPVSLRRATEKITLEASSTTQEVEAVAMLQQRIADWAMGESEERLSRRDLRLGCQVVLHQPNPPAENPAVLGPLLQEVERNRRRAAYFSVIDAYLDGFDEESPSIGTIANELARMGASWPWREGDDWPRRIAEYSLLSPDQAPLVLARRVLATGGSPNRILQDAGLDTPGRRYGGLVEAAFRAACHLVMKMSGQEAVEGQRVLIEWARDEKGDYAYERAWPDFVEASLLPWEVSEPSEAHKSALMEMLERFGGGDPRAKPARWRIVMDRAPGAWAILLRWLTRASVLQFLDIVDRLMPDRAAKLMWDYRRAFWMSYLLGNGDAPSIDAAWVAFGDDGARLARAAARESGDKSFTAFGKQYDKSPQHAALIVTMGDLTIVDWSHSAKYQVWRRGDRGAPELFKSTYRYGELYDAPLQDSHYSPRTYTWQRSLAKIIEGKTFFSPKPAWRPRGA